ncbi:MAG: bifunctional folylpolyglutamate synthase/dihydrofolate synthase [Clostridiales bacterium]|nr:bifunctional folylpolyglutamate synthase/dihydrofolate synthase [Clostridiales bacterium]
MNAVEKIESFNRFGSVLGLERTEELLKRLGNPEKNLKYIHIAGTNGKGSVSRFIYSALRANGYSVGIYTSPFLTVFNERIEVDGEYIPDEELDNLTNKVLEKVNEMVAGGFDSPTEFEVITAIAFLYFAKKACDYVVLEVGLGGRGDSTNIIEKPLVSIITSISYDHMDRLGNSLEEIAGEKAGIIKAGVPVVSNVKVTSPETLGAAKAIARKAYEKGCILHDVSKIKYQVTKNDVTGITFTTMLGETSFEDVPITMLGDHQIDNAMTALTAIEIMRKNGDIRIERSRLYKGFEEARNIGRFEIVKEEKPFVVLDGAHNEAGAEALRKAMERYFPGRKILMVTGMLKDKDVNRILDSFLSITDTFIATEPESDRKLGASELADLIDSRGAECEAVADPECAVKYALSECRNGKYKDCDVVLFAGSLYLIGKVRGIIYGN